MKKIIAIILITLGFLVGYKVAGQPAPVIQSGVATSTVAFVINPGNGFAKVIPSAELRTDENLFDVLNRAAKGANVELAYKDYGGAMGVFLTSIASTSATSDKWWQYWVNGRYANVGISSYKPQPKDVIEFKLTNEQQ